MIVDTSVMVAIFADEPERPQLVNALSESPGSLVSAGSWIEFATVLVRRFGVAEPLRVQDALIAIFDLTIAAVTSTQAVLAAKGYAEFGRGTGHRAALNFGDCFAYALAKDTGEPLLFKGDDFNHTDVLAAG